jgi:transcription elongation factor Elf1
MYHDDKQREKNTTKPCEISQKEVAVNGMHQRRKIFECQKCFKQFTKEHRLQVHLKNHEIRKQVICDACGLAFQFNYELRVSNLGFSSLAANGIFNSLT